MPDADTSSYPKISVPLDLAGSYAKGLSIGNAQLQNKLLQTENQRQGVALSQDQIDYAHKQFDGLGQLITSLAADPTIGTAEGPSKVQEYANNAVKMGFITPQQRDAALQTMPSDPAKLPQWLQTQSLAHIDSQSRFGQTYGTPGTISNGNRIIPVTTSPITGVRRIGADIPMETSPDQRNHLVNTIGPQGQTIVVPEGQIVQKAGNNALTGMPMAPVGQFSGHNQQSSSVQPQAGGGATVTPAAGQVDSIVKASGASAGKYADDQQREANFQSDMLPLRKAYEGLKQLGDTGSGPGTEPWNDAKSFLVSQGIIGPSDDVKVYDETRKYTTQLARQNGDTGSDSRLAASFAGNPSVNINNAAAQDVLKSAIALRKVQNAQVTAFNQTGLPPSDYTKWAQTWNKSQDPVAYGFDMMAPEQRAKYIQSLTPEKATAFKKSLVTAVKYGLVDRPQAAPAN